MSTPEDRETVSSVHPAEAQKVGQQKGHSTGVLRLSLSSALSELSSRTCTPMGLEEELEYSEELPSRGSW